MTQSQTWLSCVATLPGDQWRAGCGSASWCGTVPCCSTLCGCWPGAGRVLGNESSGTQFALGGRPSVGFKVLLDLLPLSFHFTASQPPWVSSAVFRILQERKAPHPLPYSIPLPLPHLCLRPCPSPASEGSFPKHIRFWSGTFNLVSSLLLPRCLPANEGAESDSFGVQTLSSAATCLTRGQFL